MWWWSIRNKVLLKKRSLAVKVLLTQLIGFINLSLLVQFVINFQVPFTGNLVLMWIGTRRLANLCHLFHRQLLALHLIIIVILEIILFLSMSKLRPRSVCIMGLEHILVMCGLVLHLSELLFQGMLFLSVWFLLSHVHIFISIFLDLHRFMVFYSTLCSAGDLFVVFLLFVWIHLAFFSLMDLLGNLSARWLFSAEFYIFLLLFIYFFFSFL